MISGPSWVALGGFCLGATKIRPGSTPGLDVSTVMGGGASGGGLAASDPETAARAEAAPNSSARPPSRT